MLTIRLSNGRGRGVFATQDISKGVVMHVDYSRDLTPTDVGLIDQSGISGHWFDHPDRAGHGLLPIGWSGLINHSRDPNSMLTWANDVLGCIGTLVALRDISKDEEIFIDYGIDMPEEWC